MNPIWKQRTLVFWQEWGKPFVMVAIVVVSFRSAVADWNDVPTGSMKPTILEGDRIFVNKLAYDLRVPLTSYRLMEWGGPQRGDIVVCFSPYDGIRLVKRCIGLPGDRIEYQDNHLFINDTPIAYDDAETDAIPWNDLKAPSQYRFSREKLDHADHLIMTHLGPARGRYFGPIVLDENEYFMTGDNRDESFDSRYFGVVPRASILGKVNAVALSLNPENYYIPRWDRFFHPLQ